MSNSDSMSGSLADNYDMGWKFGFRAGTEHAGQKFSAELERLRKRCELLEVVVKCARAVADDQGRDVYPEEMDFSLIEPLIKALDNLDKGETA